MLSSGHGSASDDIAGRGDSNRPVARGAVGWIGQRVLRRPVERSVPPAPRRRANEDYYWTLGTGTAGEARLLRYLGVGLQIIGNGRRPCLVIGKVDNVRNLEFPPVPARYSDRVFTKLNWVEFWFSLRSPAAQEQTPKGRAESRSVEIYITGPAHVKPACGFELPHKPLPTPTERP